MTYFCAECRQTITTEEFRFSMNKYKKALCSTHQHSVRLNPATRNLQDLIRNRHQDDEPTTETSIPQPQLKSIKDWIAADMDTWDKALNKDKNTIINKDVIIKVSDEQTKNMYSKRIKK
jgi:hypothetical protein